MKNHLGGAINLTLRGLNLISRKIIYFTLYGVISQNFGEKTGFKPTRYLYEPPINIVYWFWINLDVV